MKNKNIIWAGLGLAIAAAAATYYFIRRGDRKEKPPKKAPQLPLEHGGEQSEFTTLASESEMG